METNNRNVVREYQVARAHLAAAYQRIGSEPARDVAPQYLDRYHAAILAYARTSEGHADLRARAADDTHPEFRVVGDLFRECRSDITAALNAATDRLVPETAAVA